MLNMSEGNSGASCESSHYYPCSSVFTVRRMYVLKNKKGRDWALSQPVIFNWLSAYFPTSSIPFDRHYLTVNTQTHTLTNTQMYTFKLPKKKKRWRMVGWGDIWKSCSPHFFYCFQIILCISVASKQLVCVTSGYIQNTWGCNGSETKSHSKVGVLRSGTVQSMVHLCCEAFRDSTMPSLI